MAEKNVSAFEAQKIIIGDKKTSTIREEPRQVEHNSGISKLSVQSKDIVEGPDKGEENSWNKVMTRQEREARSRTYSEAVKRWQEETKGKKEKAHCTYRTIRNTTNDYYRDNFNSREGENL